MRFREESRISVPTWDGVATAVVVIAEECVMSDIALVGMTGGTTPGPESRPLPRKRHGLEDASEPVVQRWQDRLRAIEPVGEIRWDRVRSVRAQIEAGAYLNDVRLEAAIDGLLGELTA